MRQRSEQKGNVSGRPASSLRQAGHLIAAAIVQSELFLLDPEDADEGKDELLDESPLDFDVDPPLDFESLDFESLDFESLDFESLELVSLSALASFL